MLTACPLARDEQRDVSRIEIEQQRIRLGRNPPTEEPDAGISHIWFCKERRPVTAAVYSMISRLSLLAGESFEASPLPDGAVIVYYASLRREVAMLAEVLTDDEKFRARRFATPSLQHRAIASRGLLRVVLGAHLEHPPAALRFTYGKEGKPFLSVPTTTLAWNLSHAEDEIAIAIGRCAMVGVDIERIRPEFDCENLAHSLFSPEEAKDLASLPRSERNAAFYAIWTRKEAFLKADGRGLSLPLDQFSVSCGPQAILREVRFDRSATARLRLFSLCPNPGYAGAVCAEGAIFIRERTFSGKERCSHIG